MKAVRQISKCTVKPNKVSEVSKQPHYLTLWDLSFFNAQYIQKGLLFRKPLPSIEDPNPTITFIDQLKQSLSITLTHFYPLSGRMVTKKQDNPPFYGIYVDCSDESVGDEFIHAVVDISMLDILTPIDVPRIVQSFFALEGAICHDGHTEPLLVVQVTKLLDGIFVGFTFNHVIGDGTSYWKFFNAFAEITRKLRKASKEAEFIDDQYERPLLRERMFHFTEESLAKLKAKVNEDALVWRSVTRARHFTSDRKTSCRLAINDRLRLNPPLFENYFGNCVQSVYGTTNVGELLLEKMNLLGFVFWFWWEWILGPRGH
ncbi:hypothetical protein MKX01_042203 [Papaver californicum]|nr:hypothetical protein MKX01_042203 [Papaver californicum]